MVLYNGNAEVVGNFRALNFYKASDIRIKEDICLLIDHHDCRASLLKINGVSYKFKPGTTTATQRRFVGYIAQQVESVVPEAVQLIDGKRTIHLGYSDKRHFGLFDMDLFCVKKNPKGKTIRISERQEVWRKFSHEEESED
jgi:hypothetical protein